MRIRAFLLWLTAAACLWASGPSAGEFYSQGRKAEKAGHLAEAYLLYSKAAALDPQNAAYWQKSQAIRARALDEIKPAPASPPENPAATEKAGPFHIDAPTARDLADARKPLPPTELDAGPVHRDFDLRGDSRKLFEEVARAYGLECEFDADYAAGNSISFRLKDVDYREALRGLQLATGSFIVPLTEKKFLVAKDTQQKRAELEPVVTLEVHLPEAASPQEFASAIQAVQQAMALQKVAWDTSNNTVVIRDTLAKALPARAMFEQLMFPKAQVAFEVRFLEVTRNDAITYGLDLQTSFPLVPLTNWLNNKPSLPGLVNGFLTFGGGKTLMGLGIVNASIVAQLSKAAGHVLLNSFMQSLDGAPASMHVGDRYPILSSGYFGPASYYTGQGSLYAPPPAFNFEDLGLTLKMTPSVNSSEEVTVSLEAEFRVLSGAAVNGIPIISNRTLKSTTRLSFGDWVAIAGLMNNQEARSAAALAGLYRIPYLGPLLGTHSKTTSGDQVLVLIRPHLLAPPPNEMQTITLHLGSDAKPITPL